MLGAVPEGSLLEPDERKTQKGFDHYQLKAVGQSKQAGTQQHSDGQY